MAKKKHKLSTLPKWAQALIKDLKDKIRHPSPDYWFGGERIVDLSSTHLWNISRGGYGNPAQRDRVSAELERRGYAG